MRGELGDLLLEVLQRKVLEVLARRFLRGEHVFAIVGIAADGESMVR
jgi:hypothetical protein